MRKAEATDNVLFDRFWTTYPKKVGKEKALRAFEKSASDRRPACSDAGSHHGTKPCLFLEQGDLEIHSAPCDLVKSKTMGG